MSLLNLDFSRVVKTPWVLSIIHGVVNEFIFMALIITLIYSSLNRSLEAMFLKLKSKQGSLNVFCMESVFFF